MNREIKFRAWDKRYKEMHNAICSIDFTRRELVVVDGFANDRYLLGFDDVELMQYTGLKDKNGVEIYEGDIIAQRIKNGEYLNIKEVKFGCFEDPVDYFNYDGVGFYAVGNNGEENGTLLYMVKFADYEVIGNIYEHEHLLKR